MIAGCCCLDNLEVQERHEVGQRAGRSEHSDGVREARLEEVFGFGARSGPGGQPAGRTGGAV